MLPFVKYWCIMSSVDKSSPFSFQISFPFSWLFYSSGYFERWPFDLWPVPLWATQLLTLWATQVLIFKQTLQETSEGHKQAKANAMSACRVPSPLLFHLPNLKPRIRISTSSIQSVASRRSLLLLSLPLIITPNSIAFAVDEPIFDPVTVPEKRASAELSRRVSEAIRLLNLARDLQARGEFSQALEYFTKVKP